MLVYTFLHFRVDPSQPEPARPVLTLGGISGLSPNFLALLRGGEKRGASKQVEISSYFQFYYFSVRSYINAAPPNSILMKI